MFVREYGRGPALLLIHGMPSTSDDFVPLAEALASTHRVLLPDLPGYGQSPALSDYTMADCLRLVERELAERGIDETAVVGFSGGAYRAFQLALDGKVQVRAVIGLGATPGPLPSEAAPLRQLALALRAGVDLTGVAVSRFLSPRWRTDPVAVDRIGQWLSAAPGAVVASELEAWVDVVNLQSQLATIACPVLLRVGELDEATPPALSQGIAKALTSARLEVVPACGHALMIEDLTGTIQSVQRFLASV